MTCREKLMKEHPEDNNGLCFGGCYGCPSHLGYAKDPEWCRIGFETCAKCWDREVERDVRTIKDSGDRTETKTGEMSYKELLQEAQLFADDIVAAAGTDFLLTIAEAQSKFIFELLRMMKRKRGHWNALTDCANAGVYCSVCHKKVWKEDYAECNRKNKLRSNFCPNCGARMDEGYKEENYDLS